MAKPKRRKARSLLLVAVGATALSYAGCKEPQAIGNPKRPPDMGPDMAVPPDRDMTLPNDLTPSGD